MADEPINIIVDDKGSTERVKRKLDELGKSSVAANDNVGSLNKALSGLDGGMASLSGTATGSLGKALGDVRSGIGSVAVAANQTRGALVATAAAGQAQASVWSRLSAGVRSFTGDLVMHYRAERSRLEALNAGLPVQNAAAEATARHGAMARAASGDLQGMAQGARQLRTGLAALLSLGVANELLGIEDAARQAMITLTVGAGSSKGAAQAFDEIYASSQRTHSELQANIQFFSEMNNVFRSTQRDLSGVIPFMENFNRTVMLSGASGKQAAEAQSILNAAMLAGGLSSEQLGKLMSVSKISVLALAEGLGMQTKTLERLASQGMITTGSLIRGFNGSAEVIKRMAEGYIPTLSQAWNNVTNSIFAYVNNSETGSKLTEALGKGMLYLSENMGTIAPIVIGVTAAFAVLLGLQVVLWAVAVTQGIALLAVEMAVLAARAIATGVAFAIANPATVAFSVAVLALAAAVIYLTGGWDAAKKGLDDFVKGITGAKDALEKQGEKTGWMADLQKRFNGLLNEGAGANKKNGDAAGNAAGNVGKLADETQKLTNAFGEVIGGQRSLQDVLKGTTQSIRLASGEWKIFQGDAHTAAMEAEKDFAQLTKSILENSARAAAAQKALSGYTGTNADFDNGMKQNLNGYGGERTGSDRGDVTPGMFGSLGVNDGGLFKLTQGGASGTISQIQLNGKWMDVNAYQASAFAWIRQNTKLREFDAYSLAQPFNSATFDEMMARVKSKYGPEDTKFKGFAYGGAMAIPTGTAYDIGGTNAVGDKGLVQFRANKGEVVTVTPRDKANDNDGGRTIHVDKIEVSVYANDADSFKRSERQMLQQFAGKVAKALR